MINIIFNRFFKTTNLGLTEPEIMKTLNEKYNLLDTVLEDVNKFHDYVEDMMKSEQNINYMCDEFEKDLEHGDPCKDSLSTISEKMFIQHMTYDKHIRTRVKFAYQFIMILYNLDENIKSKEKSSMEKNKGFFLTIF
jgi:hypothetical protein